ncbi:retrovirus-related pol polyprotein from transposon tnt 1-94 [Lasius niger]|uniref:Retrovirus-related pol polyprotein from transposon tnt 1-94 n=1 Tax=Lasius niger TaxID=67767 RepID=A0A0J7NHG8_LASNI|nr:retrovirus-related pol polyprotein from transposon tnt 1-94 [Lasius niger]
MAESNSHDRGAFTKYGFRLLNSTNYDHWRQKMFFLLCKEDLWEVTEKPKPTEVNLNWIALNRQAMSRIGLGIEDAQLKHIVGLTTAHEMWTVFEKIYSTVNVSSRHHLYRKFTQSKWTSGTMAEYIDQMLDLVF